MLPTWNFAAVSWHHWALISALPMGNLPLPFPLQRLESGDRTEFNIYGEEYGLLAEGDCGKLTFQGTRYLSFERN